MNTLAPYLLFLLVVLSSVGPARADETPRVDAAQARAVASMELPGLSRRLRARVADVERARQQAALAAEAPASVAAVTLPGGR